MVKKLFNEAHNRLQTIVLPLDIQRGFTTHSPFTMPPAPLGHSSLSTPSDLERAIVQSINALLNNFKPLWSLFTRLVLIPLGWCWTLWYFIFVLIWRIWTLPLRFAVDFYETQVRRAFPWLPSIWRTLALLFPEGIKLPSLTSLIGGLLKDDGPTGPDLPTLDISADVDAILNGDSGGINGGDKAGSSSQIKNSLSKLESALKKIPNYKPSDLDAGLANIKTSKEWAILPYDSKSGQFSDRGDSGSIIVDGLGRIGGLLTGGGATPFFWLLPRIQAGGFPNAHVDPKIA
ncbi:hypothetical protein F5148DRAFT_1286879 [Russula earlei]|uniref:Uncharacterized protein n=1 Tax=Russula earlei TaxID=71964 RepID=A0ACC0U330_9AGAM|nr:hypothetical protein F5148DRAFT_1286879 [Russula earlei]